MEEISSSTGFMKKVVIALVVIVLALGGGYAIFYDPEQPTEECAQPANSPLASPINSGEQNPF